ncbi:MAG: hypothetical protein WAN11_24390 [Syntrophobacteraceae bacterium]
MAKKKINDDTLLQLIRDGNSPVILRNRIPLINKINELWTQVLHSACICRETAI